MDKLYPIVRRVRRPLLPPDAISPEVAAQAAEAAQLPAPAGEPKPEVQEPNANVAEE